MRLLGLALLLTVVPAWAQFNAAGAPPTMQGWAHGPASGGGGIQTARPFPGTRSNVVFLGAPWFDSYGAQPSQTTYIVLPPQTQVKPEEPPAPVTPVLIELRGDHFVRSGSAAGDRSIVPDAPRTLGKSADIPPVVLVFRDGHREQVKDYSIIGGRLYASADYVQSGAWMKTIRLSALDLPHTLALNREAGVQFVLPSGPNVVVTRP